MPSEWYKCLDEAATGFSLEDKDGKKTTNWSAGGHLQLRAKQWTAILPVVLGTAAALGHYSALPQRSDGGWDGAQPHSGHRGCNKSQMCWGDMKIHGQAPRSLLLNMSMLTCTYTHTRREKEGWGIWRMSVLKWKELLFMSCSYVLLIIVEILAVGCNFWSSHFCPSFLTNITGDQSSHNHLKQPLLGVLVNCIIYDAYFVACVLPGRCSLLGKMSSRTKTVSGKIIKLFNFKHYVVTATNIWELVVFLSHIAPWT